MLVFKEGEAGEHGSVRVLLEVCGEQWGPQIRNSVGLDEHEGQLCCFCAQTCPEHTQGTSQVTEQEARALCFQAAKEALPALSLL